MPRPRQVSQHDSSEQAIQIAVLRQAFPAPRGPRLTIVEEAWFDAPKEPFLDPKLMDLPEVRNWISEFMEAR